MERYFPDVSLSGEKGEDWGMFPLLLQNLRNTPTKVPALPKWCFRTSNFVSHFLFFFFFFFFKTTFSRKLFLRGKELILVLWKYFSSNIIKSCSNIQICCIDNYYETSLKRLITWISFLQDVC